MMNFVARKSTSKKYFVIDQNTNREFCACEDDSDKKDSEKRAEKIAAALNYVTADNGMDSYDAGLVCEQLFFQEE